MDKHIFIILIAFLIIQFILNSKKINSIESMKNCSLNDSTILQNPIFTDIKNINNIKLFNHIIDYKNNVIDNNIILSDFIDKELIFKLQNIINSYRIFDPVYDIIIDENTTIMQIKNIIIKNIILNHLHCFGDQDVFLFWVRLQLLNKPYTPFNTEILKDPLIEMFTNDLTYSINNTNIISFYKHQQNIIHVITDKHPIIKNILKDYSLLYQNKLHDIILLIMDFLIKQNNIEKNIHQQIKNLYIDIKELILINHLMKNNPKYHFGYSNNNKTFILNHKALIDNHEILYNNFMNKINNFNDLFNKHDIALADKNIRYIFLNKIKTFLTYNGIKLTNDNFLLLDINTINFKNISTIKFTNKKLNINYIHLLNNVHIDKPSFRIKQSFYYKKLNNLSK